MFTLIERINYSSLQTNTTRIKKILWLYVEIPCCFCDEKKEEIILNLWNESFDILNVES